MTRFARLPDQRDAWMGAGGGLSPSAWQYLRDLDTSVRAALLQGSETTFLQLPTNVAPGATRFVSNGRKVGEGAGSGSGVMAYWDGSHWISFATDAAVTI